MTEPVLVDTGPLVAILNNADHNHGRWSDQLKSLTRPLITCWPVLTEAAWLLRNDMPQVLELLRMWTDGYLVVERLDEAAVNWVSGFLTRFGDPNPQMADAALMYLADRDVYDTIFTLDRRDFSVYRTNDNRTLQIIPE